MVFRESPMANETKDLAGMLSNVTSHAMSVTVSIQFKV